MTYATPDDARKSWLCPLAATFAKPQSKCRGDDCPAWRWRPLLSTDPRFTSAIEREILLLSGEKKNVNKNLLHKEAVAKVMADPRKYMIPTEPEVGYCGLGGIPVAHRKEGMPVVHAQEAEDAG